jgi:hypothetical protein
LSQKYGIDAIASRYLGARRDGDRSVRFTWRGLPFEAVQTKGKQAHMTTRLLDPSGAYPGTWNALGQGADAPTLRVKHQPRVLMTSEGVANKLGKRLGLNREVQLGDQGFDECVYIDSYVEDEVAARLLPNAQARGAVQSLLEHVDRVQIMDKDTPVGLRKAGVLEADVVLGGRYDQLLDHLVTLAHNLPPVRVQAPGQLPHDLGVTLMTLSIFSCLPSLGLMLAGLFWWPTFTTGIDKAGLLGGLALWAVSLPVLWLLMRGRSTSATNLFVSACFLLFALPTGSLGTLYTLNGFQDPSLRARPGVILGTILSRGSKGGVTYYALVKTEDGALEGRFQIDTDEYYRYQRGARVKLYIGDGRLGWSWLDRIGG